MPPPSSPVQWQIQDFPLGSALSRWGVVTSDMGAFWQKHAKTKVCSPWGWGCRQRPPPGSANAVKTSQKRDGCRAWLQVLQVMWSLVTNFQIRYCLTTQATYKYQLNYDHLANMFACPNFTP